MAEFSQLALEASVPTEVMQLLPDFEVATFARSCTSHTEAEEMISQLCADSGLVETSSKLLAKASLRLLLSRCRAAEALPSLEQQATPPALAQNSAPQSAATTTTAPASSGWQESWPAKLSPEKTAALRRRFEEDYPTELLDAESFPSSRLLALTSKMVADKEIRWLPWKFRLSSKSQDDSLLLRPKSSPEFRSSATCFWTTPRQERFMMARLLMPSLARCCRLHPLLLPCVRVLTWGPSRCTTRSSSSSVSPNTSLLPTCEVLHPSRPRRRTSGHGKFCRTLSINTLGS